MSVRKQGVALLIAVFVSDFFMRTKKSSEIFYLIPKIENEQLES